MNKGVLALMTLMVSSPVVTQAAKGYVTNIDKTTVENEDFRKVLFTAANSQLVVMSLKQGEEIGRETHDVDQFFRIEQGSAVLTMGGKDYKVSKDSAFIVPAGTTHNVKNVGEEKLKLYTIYSPPQHQAGTTHHTKADAVEAEDKHKE
jgi:mannose-6-phosphate isomerase-like protein (cupin superfamily)